MSAEWTWTEKTMPECGRLCVIYLPGGEDEYVLAVRSEFQNGPPAWVRFNGNGDLIDDENVSHRLYVPEDPFS